ncbi:TIGR00266 family protein [Bacillus alkalicellulosilyticus]|uniref:TIGR00266 family protein n=1 Tax=Alkalihalobacterium alkalicellulosilyticum TaxID=1912214 RepID=UPI00099788BF|nr:TIGR00266 family protein [Bacillus alkalicellulosilyticus]
MQYEIKGETMQTLTVELLADESVYAGPGKMLWMDQDIKMSANVKGGVAKGIRRVLSGESLALTSFQASRRGKLGFAPLAPGKVLPLEVSASKQYICQKDAFMAAEDSVDLDIHIQKKIMTGLFGGEGFIMQKLSGHGMAFVDIIGDVVEFDLAPGEQLKVDTSHVALMESTVSMDIERVKGIRTIFLSGEGLFLTRLTGPGKVWVQTLSIANLAGMLEKK